MTSYKPVANPFNETWYHGTACHFTEWQIPPPPKPGEVLAVPHSALFFTTHLDYATAAGAGVCATNLLPSARVLNATKQSNESEALRREVSKNRLAALSIFVSDPKRWTEGWMTGDTLRLAFSDPLALQIITANVETLVRAKVPREIAMLAVQHNVTRGLAELICTSAKELGFDALFGHEVDRHTGDGRTIARPWLAVFNKDVLSPVEWRTKL